MIAPVIAKVVFYGLTGVVGIFSVLMVYALIRFGKSKILAIVLSAFYLLVMMSLYTAAASRFADLPLPEL